MTQLYIIRHGEMQQMKDVLQDDGLSALGILQAERLRDRLAATQEIQADVLIGSTYPRARQTTEILAPALGLTPLFDDDLQELRPGEILGLPIEEFHARYQEEDFEENPFRAVAPGAENWGQFMLRVGTTLERITRAYEGKTIVLVCHGGVIDGSLLYFFRMSALTVPPAQMQCDNTSITHWQRVPSKSGEFRWRLMKYNDAFHLSDLGSATRISWTSLRTQPISADA
jgi:probable phosphoglycerate mutase